MSLQGGSGIVISICLPVTIPVAESRPIDRVSLANRPDIKNAIRRLMCPDDMYETFSEMAAREPDMMRLVPQASVAALVNLQSVEAVEAELKRRAVVGN